MKVFNKKITLTDIFVVFASWTRVTFLNRITIADFIGAMSIIKLWIFNKDKVLIPNIIKNYFIYFLLLSVGLIVSKKPLATLTELIVQFFLLLMLIVLINEYRSNRGFVYLINLLAIGSLLSFSIGVLDVNSNLLGIERIIENEGPNVVIATFRNSGQAGAYAMVALSILIPYRVSEIYKENKSNKILINMSIILSLIGLFLSVKLASYIGFLIGISLWVIFRLIIKYPKKILIFLMILLLFYFLLTFFITNNDTWRSWFDWKMSGRGKGFSMEGSFIESNWSSSLQAFEDNFLLGSGIGGFSGVYGPFEVHSTYIKYLGETGVLGTIGYLLFMGSVLRLFYIKGTGINTVYKEFMMNSLPFFIGCLVNWAYTFHMRKREFIIMVAILYIGKWLSYEKETYN